MDINKEQLIEIIINIHGSMEKNEELLTRLDSSIGDGDHGINMKKGFNAVVMGILNNESKLENIKDVLYYTGRTLASNIGGASGVFFSTMFINASMVSNKNKIDMRNFIKMMDSAIKGIKSRGNVKVGQKTMLDVLEPAFIALNGSIRLQLDDEEILSNMINEAYIGLMNTKNLKATKGKAGLFKEKTIGHIDPGAMSTYLMLNDIVNYSKKLKN